jgi:eukaryotic-like serine/threonine-protein kinase
LTRDRRLATLVAMGREGGAPRSGSVSAGTSLRAFQETGGFEATFCRYVHTRLRRTAAFTAAASAVLFATSIAIWLASGRSATEPLLDGARSTLVGAVCGTGAIWFALGRVRTTPAILGAVDACQTGYAVLMATTFYAIAYTRGPGLLVPVLALMLVARAVFVPSRAARTCLLSALASPAVLGVALAYGTAYSRDGVELSRGAFLTQVIWEQAVLWLAIGLATFASHANFTMRLQVYEASRVGQYELVERIGAGAMGEVWRAQHALMRRPTAIKVIRADVVDDRTLRRFEEEVRQTCRLTHPNVVAIYDYGHTEEGVFFYAMELLDGVDLHRVVATDGPLPAARVIHVLAQACAGLAEAHACGLVHRDVKAANLFLCRRGLESDVVKVVDFGLVKDTGGEGSGATQLGEVCGTPETMAPETIRGRPAAAPVDVYALGAVGCYLLTGRQIFDAAHALEFVSCHLTQEPVPPSARRPDVPKDLEDVLLACLRKSPDDRMASVLDLRRRLLACADAGRWTQDDAAAWWTRWRERAPAAAASA